MKIHRAVMLVVMMLIAVGTIALLAGEAVANIGSHSLIALGIVVAAAAVSGAAFSWKRYTKRP
jgi:hypothetical protein